MVDLGMFCIDSTEVTNAQYVEFLAANVPPQSTTGEPAYCSFNTSYLPDAWPRPPAEASRPVMWVNWCSAAAFCEWSGKRLCGRIGGTPGDFNDYAVAGLSEWHWACTQGGMTTYPYGDTGDPTVCNIDVMNLNDVWDVGSGADCVGATAPFDEVFDLSANAHEWTAECTGYVDELDDCRMRGGSYEHTLSDGACDDSSGLTRGNTWSDGTFRCCADN